MGREPSCVRRVRRHVFGVRLDRRINSALSLVEHRACMHVWGSPGRLPFGWSAASRGLGSVQTGHGSERDAELSACASSDHGSQCPPPNSALGRRSAVRRRSVSLGISGSPGKAVSPKNKSFASGGSTAQYSGRESRVAVHRPPGRSAAVLSSGSSRLQRLRFRTPHVVRLPAVPSRNQICAQ